MVIMTACHAVDGGSIPLACSNERYDRDAVVFYLSFEKACDLSRLMIHCS